MDELEQVELSFKKDVNDVANAKDLEDLRVAYLGKKGKITELFSKIKEIAVEEKRAFGQKINSIKVYVEQTINNLKINLLWQNSNWMAA